MATFGDNTTGGSSDNLNANQMLGSKFTAPSDVATLTHISFYVNNASTPFNVKVLIYSTTGTFIAASADTVVNTTGWNTIAISASLTPSTVYWLGVLYKAGGSANSAYDYDNTSGTAYHASGLTYASPSNVTFSTINNYGMTIYATYTPPTVDVTVSVAAPLSSVFSIQAPTVTATKNVTVSATVLSATFSIQSATELIDEFYTPPQPLTATFSLPAANIITPDSQTIVSAPLTAVFSTPAPSVSANAIVGVSVLSATFSQPSATFKGDVAPVPSVLAATFSTPAPTISAIGNITVSSSVLAATFSLPSATVTAEQNASVSAGVLSATFTLQAVTVTAIQNVDLTATTLVATFSVNTPRKVGGLWTPQPRAQGVWTPQPRAV